MMMNGENVEMMISNRDTSMLDGASWL